MDSLSVNGGSGGAGAGAGLAPASMLQSRLLVQQLVRRVMIFVGLGKQSRAKGKGSDNNELGSSKDSGSEVTIAAWLIQLQHISFYNITPTNITLQHTTANTTL